MKCPYCDKEMEKGFIQGARGVLFSPEEKMLIYIKNLFSKKDINITGSIFELTSPAHYCYDCDCLIWKKNPDEKSKD